MSTMKHAAFSYGFVGDVKIKSFRETVHGVELTVTWRETVEGKLNTCKTTQRVDVLARTTKPKSIRARAKANKIKARAKASPARAKERLKKHSKKGKQGFHEMDEDKQEAQTGREDTEWTDTSWDHADNWTDLWSSDWSTDLWNDLAWEQAARQSSSTQPGQEQFNPTQGRSISVLGGLMMSVQAGVQQSERYMCDD